MVLDEGDRVGECLVEVKLLGKQVFKDFACLVQGMGNTVCLR